ncbi:MAG TPA: N-acyl homoserine lactonase family protein [Vicinamibacterales bacterium]|nr:N-acyl homoserine lactonase family protein [Vicinamibacterales bacterium]
MRLVRRPLLLAAFALAVTTAVAGQRPAQPTTPRIYIFDNGTLSGLDPKMFGFSREEIKEPDFVGVSYLIVHPRGTLMFDSGQIPDADFKADGTPVVDGIVRATRPLKPQMAAIGYKPSDVTYFALSHYHSDHTANANDFAGATWIVQKAERDAMFAATPAQIMKPAHFSALKSAKTRLLDNEDFDVFGDGTIVIKSAPGHTPGHQVLFVKLAKKGPVLLVGDLYHYPEEVTTGRVPTFEWNAEISKASRAKIASFLKQSGAEMWIEHDKATNDKLPKAPAYVD